MRLTLEFSPTVAVLVVEDGGETVEVRGNPKVGSLFVGDRLEISLISSRLFVMSTSLPLPSLLTSL